MKSYRIPRLQEELKKLFNITLSQKLNDPALSWVSITEVVISKDLRYAKLYFSHENNPASHEEIKEILTKSSGYFKKQIAGAQLMRTIPELSFFYDESIDRAKKVEALLASVRDDYNEDDEYDPDIDIDDYLDEDDYIDYDDEDEDDYDEFDDEDDYEDEE
ncbi:MAG: 30S ribosome-binding factor RbfA [Candidatus Cloacimonetes bacterium]|nr:30S ribosome-binding factor RbfA [Candidatus Cloacimonadota bacterium]